MSEEEKKPVEVHLTPEEIAAYMAKIPEGDSDCPECGGSGWIVDHFSDDPDDYQVGRCGLCMPPSFVIGPQGIRQGDPDLDCTDIGGRRVRKSSPPPSGNEETL
jgi:hypothetical protein